MIRPSSLSFTPRSTVTTKSGEIFPIRLTALAQVRHEEEPGADLTSLLESVQAIAESALHSRLN